MLKNATLVPANDAYYQDVHNGLLDMSHAQSFTPIFMSKPSFLDGDQSLFDAIDGLTPQDRPSLDTFLDVEPITGATMRVHKRLQVNLEVQPFSFISSPPFAPVTVVNWYPNVKLNYVPVCWFDENGELTSSQASDFKHQIYGTQAAIKWLPMIGGIAGGLLVFWATLLLICAVGRARDEIRVHQKQGINQVYVR